MNLHKNRVQSPKEYFTPPTWPPFLCLLLQHGRRDVMWTHSIQPKDIYSTWNKLPLRPKKIQTWAGTELFRSGLKFAGLSLATAKVTSITARVICTKIALTAFENMNFMYSFHHRQTIKVCEICNKNCNNKMVYRALHPLIAKSAVP